MIVHSLWLLGFSSLPVVFKLEQSLRVDAHYGILIVNEVHTEWATGDQHLVLFKPQCYTFVCPLQQLHTTNTTCMSYLCHSEACLKEEYTNKS